MLQDDVYRLVEFKHARLARGFLVKPLERAAAAAASASASAAAAPSASATASAAAAAASRSASKSSKSMSSKSPPSSINDITSSSSSFSSVHPG